MGYLHNFTVIPPPPVFINYTGKKGNFLVEKPGLHHLIKMIKVTNTTNETNQTSYKLVECSENTTLLL